MQNMTSSIADDFRVVIGIVSLENLILEVTSPDAYLYTWLIKVQRVAFNGFCRTIVPIPVKRLFHQLQELEIIMDAPIDTSGHFYY